MDCLVCRYNAHLRSLLVSRWADHRVQGRATVIITLWFFFPLVGGSGVQTRYSPRPLSSSLRRPVVEIPVEIIWTFNFQNEVEWSSLRIDFEMDLRMESNRRGTGGGRKTYPASQEWHLHVLAIAMRAVWRSSEVTLL